MKKIIILILLLLTVFIVNTNHTYAITIPLDLNNLMETDDTTDIPYENAVANSEYVRIEKVNDIWYGIIMIEDYQILPLPMGDGILLKLSRDLQQLYSVQFDYTTLKDCNGLWAWTLCIGDKIEPYEGTEIVYDLDRDGSLADWLTSDEIVEWDGPDYDYWLFTNVFEPIDTVFNIRLDMVLTDVEVIDLRLDIQDQFDDEVEQILLNDFLTDEDRDVQIAGLVDEYSEYTIDFDERITAVPSCEGEECVLESEAGDGTIPAWDDFKDDLLSSITKIGVYILSFLLGGAFISMLGYLIFVKVTKTTGSVALEIGKGSIRSGQFWGRSFFKGASAVANSIWVGFKSIFNRK